MNQASALKIIRNLPISQITEFITIIRSSFETKTDDSLPLSEKNLKNFQKILYELINEIFNSKINFKKQVLESF